MVERLLITMGLIVFFAVVILVMKRQQVTAASRASRRLMQSGGIPTIVYFWSPGCPVCKMTQKAILLQIVAEYGNEHVALNAFNTDERPEIAKEWGVRTLPTTFLIDATGAIRHVNNGLAVAETLREQLKSMMNRSRAK